MHIIKSYAVSVRLGNQLEEMQRKHSLHCRWFPTDKEYKENEFALRGSNSSYRFGKLDREGCFSKENMLVYSELN